MSAVYLAFCTPAINLNNDAACHANLTIHTTMATRTHPTRTNTSTIHPPTHNHRLSPLQSKSGGGIFDHIPEIVLGLLIITILSIFVLHTSESTKPIVNQVKHQSKEGICSLNNPASSCPPSINDKDGDCLPDNCDLCINYQLTKPARAGIDGASERQTAGSDLFDKDGDWLPDGCDPEPENPKVSTCKIDDKGHCPVLSTFTISGKKVGLAQLASIGLQELQPNQKYRLGETKGETKS